MTATALQLSDLNGLLASESSARAREGDRRDKVEIATAILAEAGLPDLSAFNDRIIRMLRRRHQGAAAGG